MPSIASLLPAAMPPVLPAPPAFAVEDGAFASLLGSVGKDAVAVGKDAVAVGGKTLPGAPTQPLLGPKDDAIAPEIAVQIAPSPPRANTKAVAGPPLALGAPHVAAVDVPVASRPAARDRPSSKRDSGVSSPDTPTPATPALVPELILPAVLAVPGEVRTESDGRSTATGSGPRTSPVASVPQAIIAPSIVLGDAVAIRPGREASVATAIPPIATPAASAAPAAAPAAREASSVSVPVPVPAMDLSVALAAPIAAAAARAVATPVAPAAAPATQAAPMVPPRESHAALPAGVAPSPQIQPTGRAADQLVPADTATLLVQRAARASRVTVATPPPDTAATPALATAPTIAPVAADADAQVPLDLTRHTWPAAMIDRIERLRDEADAVSTSIRVLPDALGAIDVSVRKEGEVTHVHLAAEHAQTRALLADAQPKLVEIAEQRGVKLGQTQVEAGPGSGGGQPAPQQHAARQPAAPPRARADAPHTTQDHRIA